MLDIGWQELFIVGILAIIVIGPKDLPRALRTAMQWIRKARGLAREFQSGVDEMVREADLDDLKQDLNKISHTDIEKTIKDTVDPTGELDKDLDMSEVQRSMDETAKDAVKDDKKSDGGDATGNPLSTASSHQEHTAKLAESDEPKQIEPEPEAEANVAEAAPADSDGDSAKAGAANS